MTAPLQIAHVAIAVPSLEEALRFYRDQLGLTVSEIIDAPERGLRIAMMPCGESYLELMEPVGPSSQISKFLERRGPGIHHVCLHVNGIQLKLDDLAAQGVRLVSSTPETGAEGFPVAFIHPKSTSGVLLELQDESGDL